MGWHKRGRKPMAHREHRRTVSGVITSNVAAARARRFIKGLGPYQSLGLLLIPTSLVEPLKLVAVYFAGEGHWITGTLMIVLAYSVSLLLVERLFKLVKPK